jgi:hypothetical protein
MAKFDLKVYARQGAAARVTELNAELESIYRAFPDLRRGSRLVLLQGRLVLSNDDDGSRCQSRRRHDSGARPVIMPFTNHVSF